MSLISGKRLTTIFQKNLFKVFQAGSIAEGEQSILDNSPDVIILDLMLPDGSGLNSLQRY